MLTFKAQENKPMPLQTLPEPVTAQPPQPEAIAPPAESADAWLKALRKSTMQAVLQSAALPAISQQRLGQTEYQSPEELQEAITREKEYLAALAEQHTVQLGGNAPRAGAGIALGHNGFERFQAAFEAMLDGVSPPRGIAPLSGIREAYHLLSGDYEMTGVFNPDQLRFANVNSSTMANMTADALNKRIINTFKDFPRWWEPITTIEDFASLQDAKWISLGGVGELPTVAEGAAYTELTWDDLQETDSFIKKGGYLGITLEAIDKDDTRRLRAAPALLARSAWLTLSKAISTIFTTGSGVGPTMADGVVLFHAASHANLGTTALSYAAWEATRTAMRKQTEIHSAERLGALTAPKFLLVPPDLEGTALQTLASEGETGTANNDTNVYAEGNFHDARLAAARRRVIVVDLWTDTDNWAAVADPMLYPSIGLGFRYGRTPEIFSVASPTAGLMFSNDTMPVKVRFFFATGPTDYRGLYKHNVS